MREGRDIMVPKNGSYRIHPSGVLEINLEATTTYFAQGVWNEVKDSNMTKYLKYFQETSTRGASPDQ
jgi:hypothetical protein